MNTDKIYAERLAGEYAIHDNSKILALKKLDRRAKLPANLFAYSFGISGALVAGLGMCLAMQVIAAGPVAVAFGIGLGCIGFAAVAVNYPIYLQLLKKGKEKYGYTILHLAKEISDR